MPTALASFWGGYLISFKLISLKRAREVEEDIDTMRREAVLLGEGSKFTIDVSRHEYIEDKQAHDLSGYQVFVYSPEMIVCEKIRAICQQMPEYAAIIQRKGLGNQRARDFVDIEALIRKFKIDLGSERADAILKAMFDIKHVPLSLIGKIPQTRDFHALGFDSVKATMKPNEEVQPFDYYFDFVVREIHKLKPLGDV